MDYLSAAKMRYYSKDNSENIIKNLNKKLSANITNRFDEEKIPEQDPPVYYSIVILTILYYLRVVDLMGITSPCPRENIIAGNYILADTQVFLSKHHRQQNKKILIRHSPG